MTTIETTARVTRHGELKVHVPRDVPPGEHNIILTIYDSPPANQEGPMLDIPVDHVGVWPSHLSLRREDLYGDGGR